MFYWKSALVLILLIGLALPVAMGFAQTNWERLQTQKLMLVAALISCATVSVMPILLTPFLFAAMMLMCIDQRAPVSAPFLFLLIWTPSASGLLELAHIYFAPLTIPLVYGGGLVVAYVLNPRAQLRPKISSTDVYLAIFLVAFWFCVSLRDSVTAFMRNCFIYAVPYGLCYWGVSRTRIERPELALRWIVIATGMVGAMCVFETVKGWPLYSGLHALKGLKEIADYNDMVLLRAGVARSYGPFVHPLVGSVILGMGGIATVGLVHLRGLRWPILLIVPSILLGLVVTLSRSGVVALIVGLIALQILRRKPLSAMVIIALGLAGLLVLQLISGIDGASTAAYRLTLISGIPAKMGGYLIFGYREAINLGLLDEFMQGQGLVDLVNVYLSLALIGGLMSLIPYVIFLFASFSQYRQLKRTKPAREQLIVAQTLVAMQIGYMVAAMFIGAWTLPMLLSILCAGMLVALRTEAEQAPQRAAIGVRMAQQTNDPFPLPAIR